MTEGEVLLVLARIARRRGKPGDWLRAVELLGRHMGMFREQGEHEGASFAEIILAAQRWREAITINVIDPLAADGSSVPPEDHEWITPLKLR